MMRAISQSLGITAGGRDKCLLLEWSLQRRFSSRGMADAAEAKDGSEAGDEIAVIMDADDTAGNVDADDTAAIVSADDTAGNVDADADADVGADVDADGQENNQDPDISTDDTGVVDAAEVQEDVDAVVDADVDVDDQENNQDPDIPMHTRENETDTVSILVQFFGTFDISDSFAQSNLRISAASKDILNEIDKDNVKLYFVFHKAKSVVGAGSFDRMHKTEVEGDDPLEVPMLWSRLVLLPYSALGDGSSAKSILALMEDESWEMKKLTSDQAITLQEAVDDSAEVRIVCCMYGCSLPTEHRVASCLPLSLIPPIYHTYTMHIPHIYHTYNPYNPYNPYTTYTTRILWTGKCGELYAED
jgi:hypothetical protein